MAAECYEPMSVIMDVRVSAFYHLRMGNGVPASRFPPAWPPVDLFPCSLLVLFGVCISVCVWWWWCGGGGEEPLSAIATVLQAQRRATTT